MRKERTQLILCTTEDGQSHIQSRADGGTVWLSGDREYAEAQGWTVGKATGHAWGRSYCPYNDAECRCDECCIVSVWSTPKNPNNHARQLKRAVDNCTTHRRLLACGVTGWALWWRLETRLKRHP